jgi:hypothetical protein
MENESDNKTYTDGTYTLLKDYSKAYDFLVSKNNLVAYVDYNFGGDSPARDVCMVRRHQNYSIQFIARGIQYGGIMPFDEEDGTEYELFIKECQRMNALFILPN